MSTVRLQVAAPETPAQREARVLACAARLPSPPDVVLAVASAIDREDGSADAVAKLIERDVALTARVLRVANSSFYGMAGRVGTLRDALAILGFSTVGTLVMAAGIAGRYGGAKRQQGLAGFWRHGMLTAVSAAALARRTGDADGIAFVGGLLHDIGTLVLADAFPEGFRAPQVPPVEAQTQAVLDVERVCYGIDHAALGGMLAERWGYPGPICAALREHHAPDSGEALARLIGHADRIAHALLQPDSGEVLRAAADALVALSASDSAPDLLAEIERQAGGAELLLGAG